MIYNPEFNDLIQLYKRPFFFYAQDSYTNARELDTGKERLMLDQQKMKQNKKSVNDLFSEEEVKRQSLKDRFSKIKNK
jgi:hypothetical protein